MFSLPFLLAVLAGASSARAGVYTYRDEKGTLQAVSSPDEIPEKYRANSKVLSSGRPEAAPSGEAEVSLRRLGNSLLVPVDFGKAGVHPMVLDTGAEISMISESLAAKIGGARGPMVSMGTASGVVQRPLTEVPETSVAGFKVRGLRMVVNDLPGNHQAQGLLGVDFLNHFRIRLDTESGVLHLEKKRKEK